MGWHRLVFLVMCLGACGGDGGGVTPGPADASAGPADAGLADAPPVDPTLVSTPDGPLRGELADGYRVFRGIPYAAPPTGDNRWRAPRAVAPWTEERDATAFGPICPQEITGGIDVGPQDEDCLYANVWTPWPLPAEPLPVMLFFHGGGFTLYAGSLPTFDGADLAATKGVIVVTVNYRLGPLGFLALPELVAEEPSTGMYGIQDQQAVLRWLQSHIAAFGGDPAQVTIFGESAGAVSVNVHLVAPASRGLFARAIIESNLGGQVKTALEALAIGDQLAAAVGCTDPSSRLTCLRAKPVGDVIAALPVPAGLIIGEGVTWRPSVNGVVLSEPPAMSFLAGDVAKVPVIVGANQDEGTLFTFFAGGSLDESAYHRAAALYGPESAAAVEARYPLTDFPSVGAAVARIFRDGGFVCVARREARLLADVGNDTYLYHFSYVFHEVSALGAFHGAELAFVFGTPVAFFNLPIDDETRGPLSEAIQGYWTRLAASGDPNAEGAVVWPAYSPADASLTLDVDIAAQTGLSQDDCDFWDSLVSAI